MSDEAVLTALGAFYGPNASKAERDAAHVWLLRFQESSASWVFAVGVVDRISSYSAAATVPLPPMELVRFACSTLENKLKREWDSLPRQSRAALTTSLCGAVAVSNAATSAIDWATYVRICVAASDAVVLSASSPTESGVGNSSDDVAALTAVVSGFASGANCVAAFEYLRILSEEAVSISRSLPPTRAALVSTLLCGIATAVSDRVRDLIVGMASASQQSPVSAGLADVLSSSLRCVRCWAEAPGIPQPALDQRPGIAEALFAVSTGTASFAAKETQLAALLALAEIVAGKTGPFFSRRPGLLNTIVAGLMSHIAGSSVFGSRDFGFASRMIAAFMLFAEAQFGVLTEELQGSITGFLAAVVEHPSRAVAESGINLVSELHSLKNDGCRCVESEHVRSALVRLLVALRRHSALPESGLIDEDLELFRDRASLAIMSIRALVGPHATLVVLETFRSSRGWSEVESALFCLESLASESPSSEECSGIISGVISPLVSQADTFPTPVMRSLFSLIRVMPCGLASTPDAAFQCAALACKALALREVSEFAVPALLALTDDHEAAAAIASADGAAQLCSSIFGASAYVPLQLRSDVSRAACAIALMLGDLGVASIAEMAKSTASIAATTRSPYEAAAALSLLADIAASLFDSPQTVLRLHEVAWPAAMRAVLIPKPPKQSSSSQQLCSAETGDTVAAACHLLRMELFGLGKSGPALVGCIGDLLSVFKLRPRSCILVTVSVAASVITAKQGQQQPQQCVQQFADFIDEAAPLAIRASRESPCKKPGMIRALFEMALQLTKFQRAAIFSTCKNTAALFSEAVRLLGGEVQEPRAVVAASRFLAAVVENAPQDSALSVSISSEQSLGMAMCLTLLQCASRPSGTLPDGLSVSVVGDALHSLVERYPTQSRQWLQGMLGSNPLLAPFVAKAMAARGNKIKMGQAVSDFVAECSKQQHQP